MNLIVETDLGRDPDDFFAILYLIAIGVNIRCVTITPGHPDQVAIARFIRDQLGLDFTIGAHKFHHEKRSSSGMHYKLLEKYKALDLDSVGARWQLPDGPSDELISIALQECPDSELLIIGPASNVHSYFKYIEQKKGPNLQFKRATMQGGFCGYHIHRPHMCLEKFEGMTWNPTFNLNGDRPAGLAFINANIPERRFIGKNICHTVLYNEDIHRRIKPNNRASELFKEGMDIYLSEHDEKKFHDPAAAVVHMYPHVVTWVKGTVQKIEQGWGTIIPGTDNIAVDLDYDKLWDHITEFK